MKLRDLTKSVKENPAQPDAKMAQKTAMGAKMAAQKMAGGGAGGSGAMMSKALDKVAQGGALPANLAKQIAPFAKQLTSILSDQQLRTRFMQLVKAAEKNEEISQEQDSETDSLKQLAGIMQTAKTPDTAYEDLKALAGIQTETATAGATSAGSIATVANPVHAYAKIPKDSKGQPKAPQKKNPDGTAKNALDIANNLMGGNTIKR